jgi:hypothetical protein
MVYKFDPIYFNGTVFSLDASSQMVRGCYDFLRKNEPIPASFCPKTLTFKRANDVLPDMFHMSRGFLVFSERAREVIEHWAPGQVEFIPVAHHAKPDVASTLNFDRAYYFINVLGRAQRLRWNEVPLDNWQPQDDDMERFSLQHDFHKWKFREREARDPFIWHDTWWRDGNKEYRAHDNVFIEDVLWRELEANFPDQLNALRADED